MRNSLEQKFGEPKTSKLVWVAINFIEINKEEAKKIFYIIDTLEENDDVQTVSSNFDVSDDILASLTA